jgi:cytolysin (calcineurin-like family phosphatase)
MSSLTRKLKADRSKIDADNPTELKYWTKALDSSKDEVLAAVEKVGNSAAAVRKELASGKQLEPHDFPLNADGKKITKQDGTPIAEALDPVVASDVADRLNGEEARREEEKWSA